MSDTKHPFSESEASPLDPLRSEAGSDPTLHSPRNPKWKLILGSGVLVSILVGILFVFSNRDAREPNSASLNDYPELSFEPSSMTIESGSEGNSIEVILNTGPLEVTAAALEIQFSPQDLRISEIKPGAELPLVLSVSRSKDTASIVLGTRPGTSISGIQKIATIFFDAERISSSTLLKFSENTQISAFGESGNILRSTSSVTVTIQAPGSPQLGETRAEITRSEAAPISAEDDDGSSVEDEQSPDEGLLPCTYFVATSGSDSNNGRLSSPFASMQKGVDILSPGDTLCVRGGVYTQTVTVRTSGTSSRPITIMAYPGEYAIIDGRSGVDCLNCGLPSGALAKTDPLSGKGFNYDPLVGIEGDYVRFEGFTITRSMGRCIRIWREAGHVTGTVIRNNRIRDCRESGIVFINHADQTLIENNDVSLAGAYAEYSRGARTLDWPAGIAVIFASNTTLRGNVVHENWGEGVIIGREASDSILEDNVLYDNYALQLYLHATDDVLVQRNLFYHSGNPEYFRGGSPSACIVISSAEPQWAGGDVTAVRVINNVTRGCSTNIAFWDGVGSARQIVIEHNTLINAYDPIRSPVAIRVGYANENNLSDVLIANNLVLQDSGELIVEFGQSGVTYENNLWSRDDVPANASSSGDVLGDPGLADPAIGSNPIQGARNWARITISSPAIGGASTGSGVAGDFFGAERDSQPDIGAHEYRAPLILTPEPESTRTPTPALQIPGDLDGDGDVDLDDHAQLVADYGSQGDAGFIPADIDQDGSVTIFDYNILQMNYGKSQTDPVP